MSMVRVNKTKTKLSEGKAVFGTICNLRDPAVVEMIGWAGYDFVFIDMEHSGTDFAHVQALVRAAEMGDVTPLVRIREGAYATISPLLEMGVQGFVIPRVKNTAELREAIRWTKFPPEGHRGVCSNGGRMWRYSGTITPPEAEEANAQTLVGALIEEKELLEDLDNFVATEGLDVVSLALQDMAGSLGFIGQPDHPSVRDTVRQLEEAVERNGRVKLGGLCFNPADIAPTLKRGRRFIMCPVADTSILYNAYSSAMRQVRQIVGADAGLQRLL